MISIRQLSEQIEALNGPSLSLADFEDWFVSESWGSYAVTGDDLSNVIAAVHHALYGYEAGVFDESQAKTELATAIRPFVPSANAIHLVFARGPGPELLNVEPTNYFPRWNVVPLAANENTLHPAWVNVGSSNSTIHRILPQRETESAFGPALVNSAPLVAAQWSAPFA